MTPAQRLFLDLLHAKRKRDLEIVQALMGLASSMYDLRVYRSRGPG